MLGQLYIYRGEIQWFIPQRLHKKWIADGLKAWKKKLKTVKLLKYRISSWPQGMYGFLK